MNEVLLNISVTPLVIISLVLSCIIIFKFLNVLKLLGPIKERVGLVQGAYYEMENGSILYINNLLASGLVWKDSSSAYNLYNIQYSIDNQTHPGMKVNLQKYLNVNNAKMISTEEAQIKLKIIKNRLLKI